MRADPILVQRVLAAWALDQQRRDLVHERTTLLSELDALEREQFTRTLTARRERAEADALEGFSPTTLWLRLTGELAEKQAREEAEANKAFASTMKLGAQIGERDARVLEIDQTLRERGDTWQPVVEALGALETQAGGLDGPRAALEAARRLEALDDARYRLKVAVRAIGSWGQALLCATSGSVDREILAIAKLADARAELVRDALGQVDRAFEAVEIPPDPMRGLYGTRLDHATRLSRTGAAQEREVRMLELLPILARDLESRDPGLIERAARAAAEADLESTLGW